jgi:hypothetical protein
MWFVIIALASIVASLIFGRILARASAEQTFPHRAHGPVTESSLEVDRLTIAKEAAERRVKVHLN